MKYNNVFEPIRKIYSRIFAPFRIFLIIVLVFRITELILEHSPSQLWKTAEKAAEDLEFNDIYYFTREDDFLNPQVVLINTGSLSADNIRPDLITLIQKVDSCGASAIGLDLLFTQFKDSLGSDQTLYDLIKEKNVVVGIEHNWPSVFCKNESDEKYFGAINLPGSTGVTIREYYTSFPITDTFTAESFARKLFKVNQNKKNKNPEIKYATEETIRLKYQSIEKGIYNYLDPKTKNTDESIYNFPAVEAADVLDSFKENRDIFKSLFNGKIVIFGSLGAGYMDNEHDFNDKHRVPVDHDLINRSPTMAGSVIHANALQMMIDDDYLIEPDSWLICLLPYLIAFFYLMFTMWLDKQSWGHLDFLIKDLDKWLVLAVMSIIAIRVTVYAMQEGYYIHVGFYLILLATMEALFKTASDIDKYLLSENETENNNHL